MYVNITRLSKIEDYQKQKKEIRSEKVYLIIQYHTFLTL